MNIKQVMKINNPYERLAWAAMWNAVDDLRDPDPKKWIPSLLWFGSDDFAICGYDSLIGNRDIFYLIHSALQKTHGRRRGCTE